MQNIIKIQLGVYYVRIRRYYDFLKQTYDTICFDVVALDKKSIKRQIKYLIKTQKRYIEIRSYKICEISFKGLVDNKNIINLIDNNKLEKEEC